MQPTESEPLIKEIHCHKAEGFLDHLSPTGPVFRDVAFVDTFLHRGHADQDQKLLPRALRPEEEQNLLALAGLSELGSVHSALVQHWAEFNIASRFFALADAAGLPLPEGAGGARKILRLRMDSEDHVATLAQQGGAWPPDELLPVLGLAQHYGLPTRLLDWSRSPLVAAYFAAATAVRAKRETGAFDAKRIAVWALDAYALHRTIRDPFRRHELEIVVPPAAGNPNLCAQLGVGTVYRPLDSEHGEQVDRRPLDQLIADLPQTSSMHDAFPLFFKISLPVEEAAPLMGLLRTQGIHAAALIPGFGGAAEAVREALLCELLPGCL